MWNSSDLNKFYVENTPNISPINPLIAHSFRISKQKKRPPQASFKSENLNYTAEETAALLKSYNLHVCCNCNPYV